MFFLPSSERSLNKLFAGDATGTVVDQLVLIAIPTLALTVAGLSPQAVSVLSTSQWLPALVLSGFFGKLVDSKDRRYVLGMSALMSAFGAGGMAFVGSVEPSLRLYYLLAFGLLFAAGSTLFLVGSAANVPKLAFKVTVPEAIGAQASVRNVARIAGLAITGPAVQFFGATVGVAAAALLSLIKVLAVGSIPESESDVADRQRAQSDKTSAWKVTLSNITLRRLLIASATMNAGGAMVVSSFFAFAYNELKISPFSVGVMLFVGGVSAILASKRSKSLMEKFSPRKLCAVTGLLAGAAVWAVPASRFLPTLPTLFIYEAVFSSAVTVFSVSFSVVRQRLIASHLLGKLVAVSSTAGAAAMVAGSLVGAVLIDRFGLFASVCAGCALSSVGAMSLIGLTRTSDEADMHGAAANK